MRPRLTICTGTRHRPQSLNRFIQSACDAATVLSDILIADASDKIVDFKLPYASGPIEKITHYHESPRLFPNQGYDQLVRKAETEYVAFFNDDCEFIKGWDEIAVSFMDSHKEVGIGCLYWYDLPGGSPYLQSFQHMVYANFGICRKSAGDESGWFETREAFVPELQRVERLTFYGNDVGLAFKMIDAGFGVVGIPGCVVKHHREQDQERVENYRQFVQGIDGNTAGRVLYELWGGLQGFERLRQKAKKFDYLGASIDASGNVKA